MSLRTKPENLISRDKRTRWGRLVSNLEPIESWSGFNRFSWKYGTIPWKLTIADQVAVIHNIKNTRTPLNRTYRTTKNGCLK